MESNRDEATRCLDLATAALHSGDPAKARRLLRKAKDLYAGVLESPRGRDLLSLLEDESHTTSQKQSTNSSSPTAHRRRRPSSGPAESKSSGPEYTQEQVEGVKRIKASRDYYEILSVPKTSTDTDLKKAYRKLALQFHPDKNKAPGSGEAFKAIGNAFAILSDAEKRKQYDQFGVQGTSQHTPRTRNYDGYTYTRGFESEMTAEELFNMFFGGGFPSSTVYNQQQRTQRRRYTNSGGAEQEAPQSGATMALQVLPILFFILVTLLSGLFVQDPVYSLQRSQKYNVKKLSAELEVPYFVKESFAADYSGNLKRLEALIEEEYIGGLRNECFKQRNYKEHMMWRARNFGDAEMQAQARELQLPSCDQLHGLRQKSRYA